MGMLALYLLAWVGWYWEWPSSFLWGYGLYQAIRGTYYTYYTGSFWPTDILLWIAYHVMALIRELAILVVWMLLAVGWMWVTYLFLRWGQRDLSKVIAMADA